METEKTTKELLLQRALHLFAEKGYESVGVQELCTVCGVTKPTLYYYFTSKLGLFQAILDTEGAELHRILSAACASYEGTDGEEFHATLSALVSALYDFAAAHEDFFRLYYSLSANLSAVESQQAFVQCKNGIDRIYEALFQDAAALFGNMRGFESVYAQLFQSTACYTVFQAVSGSLSLDADTIGRITHAFLWGAAS